MQFSEKLLSLRVTFKVSLFHLLRLTKFIILSTRCAGPVFKKEFPGNDNFTILFLHQSLFVILTCFKLLFVIHTYLYIKIFFLHVILATLTRSQFRTSFGQQPMLPPHGPLSPVSPSTIQMHSIGSHYMARA